MVCASTTKAASDVNVLQTLSCRRMAKRAWVSTVGFFYVFYFTIFLLFALEYIK